MKLPLTRLFSNNEAYFSSEVSAQKPAAPQSLIKQEINERRHLTRSALQTPDKSWRLKSTKMSALSETESIRGWSTDRKWPRSNAWFRFLWRKFLKVTALWRDRSYPAWWMTLLFSSRYSEICAPTTVPPQVNFISRYFPKRLELSLMTVQAFPKASTRLLTSRIFSCSVRLLAWNTHVKKNKHLWESEHLQELPQVMSESVTLIVTSNLREQFDLDWKIQLKCKSWRGSAAETNAPSQNSDPQQLHQILVSKNSREEKTHHPEPDIYRFIILKS